MNAGRLAKLYRARAAIDLEIAEELEREAAPKSAESEPKRRRRVPPPPPPPTTNPTDLDVARAKRALKRAGYRVKTP